MAKELKQIITADYERQLGDLEGGVLIDYHGINAERTVDLRCALRKDGVSMQVLHNRLARRVFAERDDVPGEFADLLSGPCALLVGEEGVLTASKSLSNWRKKNRDLAKVKGGFFEGRVLSVEDVAQMAKIPDKETLQGQVAAMFLSPAQLLASCGKAVLEHFAGCAKARKDELESDG